MGLFRWGLTVLLFLLLSLIAAGIVSAAEPARTIRVGAYDNSPKIYKDIYDKPAGVFADVLSYIARKENWNLEYVWGTWNAGLARLKKGEIDIMPDVAVSPEREKEFDFTNETLLNSWAVIYVKKDSSIASITDLEGKKISILKSSVYESGQEGIFHYLKAFGLEATVIEVNNYREALDYLSLGKSDAAVVSYISGLANEKDYPNIKATKIFLEPTELRFALTKGDSDNPYLTERLDYWIKQLRNGSGGFYSQTLEKYGLQKLETETDSQTPKQQEVLPFWALQAVLGVIMIAASFWLIIRIFPSKHIGK